jgi:hypothetical protein
VTFLNAIHLPERLVVIEASCTPLFFKSNSENPTAFLRSGHARSGVAATLPRVFLCPPRKIRDMPNDDVTRNTDR